MTPDRRRPLPKNATKTAHANTPPPRISIHSPWIPHSVIIVTLVIVPATSRLLDMPDAPSAHHGNRRPPRK
jgi:hypothetical protein